MLIDNNWDIPIDSETAIQHACLFIYGRNLHGPSLLCKDPMSATTSQTAIVLKASLLSRILSPVVNDLLWLGDLPPVL